jgi:hypothetical protein
MNFLKIVFISLFLFSISYASYEDELKKWKSYKDIESWMKDNWSFDKSRQIDVIRAIKKAIREEKGFDNVHLNDLALDPSKSFDRRSGYCGDATLLITDALNKIDQNYNAKNVFIKNGKGRPNHWVTAFTINDKLHIIDYGAGKKWKKMKGVHGPFESLEQYRSFLNSLYLRNFYAQRVFYRD